MRPALLRFAKLTISNAVSSDSGIVHRYPGVTNRVFGVNACLEVSQHLDCLSMAPLGCQVQCTIAILQRRKRSNEG